MIRVDLDVPSRRGRTQRGKLVEESTSWWTSRATAGRVTEGFTKEEVLKTDRLGADDEVLTQVGELLAELGGGGGVNSPH